MKKLFSKMFFASDCARGAAFALTLVTVGNYLWFSFFPLLVLALDNTRRLFPWLLLVWDGGAVLITLYALVIIGCSLTQLVKLLRRERRFEVLWYQLPAGLCLVLGVVGFVRVFPPLRFVYVILDGEHPWHEGEVTGWWSVGFSGLPPRDWAAVFLFALVLLLAGGLLLTKMCAAAEKRKFRSAFGIATLTLWAVLALGYVVSIGLAMYESRECSAVRAAVECRFGRPLTAAGVEALYRENGKVDAAFWERLKKFGAALPEVELDKRDDEGKARKIEFSSFCLPDRPTKEILARFDRYCRDNRLALEKYESCFDRVPPLPPRRFVSGALWAAELSQLRSCRSFAGIEYNRLISFLAAGDVAGAWTCYRRIGNSSAVLEKDPFLLSGLVWLSVGQMRLDCVEKLLESRLPADDKLDKLDADLAALERAIPCNHRQSMYAEAVSGHEIFLTLENDLRKLPVGDEKPNLPLGSFAPYRWIFPQWWHFFALDKKTLLKRYLAPDMMHVVVDDKTYPFMLSSMLSVTLNDHGARFYALTARARGMRVLIRAEKYRRKHGEFPKTLADLPLDPFTGKPLVYEVGKKEIIEDVGEKAVDDSTAPRRTVDVVQVHSDPAKTFQWGLCDSEADRDKTRAMIRLP